MVKSSMLTALYSGFWKVGFHSNIALMLSVFGPKLFMVLIYLLLFSSRFKTRKECTTNGGRNSRVMFKITRNFFEPTDPSGTGSSAQNLRWVNAGLVVVVFLARTVSICEWFQDNLTLIFDLLQETFMGNTMIFSDYLSMAVFHQNRTTCSWAITWIEENSHWRQYACF